MLMNSSCRYDPSVQVILGIPFNNVTFSEAVEWARQRIVTHKPGYITTANWDFLRLAWNDPELQRILIDADLVVADGIPIVWMSRLFGKPLKERVTGSDLVPLLAEMAARERHSLFLLGGAPGVGEKAAAALTRRFPRLRIAGHYSPPLADILGMDHTAILSRIEEANPDILLIAFGAPKQEKFANLHVRSWKVPVSIGVGGTLDFLAGTQTRAPKFVQRLALEWLWRLMTAPRRLTKRYVAGFAFLITVCRRLLSIRMTPNHKAPPDPEAVPPADQFPDVLWLSYAELKGQDPAALFSSGNTHSLVLDLRGVYWLSSTELGGLLQVARNCRLHDRRLILCHASARVDRLLKSCLLTEYLDLTATIADTRVLLGQLSPGVMKGRVYRDEDNHMIFQTPRELTAVTVDAFKAEAAALVSYTPKCQAWIVDLQHTRFVDSAGLGLFVAWHTKAALADIPFEIRNAQKAVEQTFRIARLNAWLKPSTGDSGAPA